LILDKTAESKQERPMLKFERLKLATSNDDQIKKDDSIMSRDKSFRGSKSAAD